EHDLRDLAGDPGSAVGIGELAQPGIAYAFGAADRLANDRVALEQHHVEVRRGALRLPGRDRTRGPSTNDQQVRVVRHAGTMVRAPTGHGAMHLRHPVHTLRSTTRSARR